MVPAVRTYNSHERHVLYLAAELPHLALAETAFEVGRRRSCKKRVLHQRTLEWNMIISSVRGGEVSWSLSPFIFKVAREKQPTRKYGGLLTEKA